MLNLDICSGSPCNEADACFEPHFGYCVCHSNVTEISSSINPNCSGK